MGKAASRKPLMIPDCAKLLNRVLGALWVCSVTMTFGLTWQIGVDRNYATSMLPWVARGMLSVGITTAVALALAHVAFARSEPQVVRPGRIGFRIPGRQTNAKSKFRQHLASASVLLMSLGVCVLILL